jgi:hypothetical protein
MYRDMRRHHETIGVLEIRERDVPAATARFRQRTRQQHRQDNQGLQKVRMQTVLACGKLCYESGHCLPRLSKTLFDSVNMSHGQLQDSHN